MSGSPDRSTDGGAADAARQSGLDSLADCGRGHCRCRRGIGVYPGAPQVIDIPTSDVVAVRRGQRSVSASVALSGVVFVRHFGGVVRCKTAWGAVCRHPRLCVTG